MHSRHELLKARFNMVRQDLDPIVVRLKPELLNWAPASGMRTLGGQIVEIVATEIQLIERLHTNRELSDAEAQVMIGDTNDLDILRAALVSVRGQTLEYLDSLTPQQLAEEIQFEGGWFGSLMLPTVPRAEVFLNIADHEWYHVGQLTSYLWALGEDPYEW
ncbi:DinB family protein [bacterium]|nr:MAG: DinB family protein [bacterium]